MIEITENFKKWLTQNNLFQYYQENPTLKNEIFKDYQWESFIKQGEDLMLWIMANEELANKLYPDVLKHLETSVLNIDPLRDAKIIENTPKHFKKWREETNEYVGASKKKAIKNQMLLMRLILNRETNHVMTTNALEKIRDEVEAELIYYQKELENWVKKEVEIPDWKTRGLTMENWLKENVYLHYHFPNTPNPDLKKEIDSIQEHNYSLFFKEQYLDYVEQEYPEIYKIFLEILTSNKSFEKALILDKIIKDFSYHCNSVKEEKDPILKRKKIENHLNNLKDTLSNKTDDRLMQITVDNLNDSINYQMGFWQDELEKLDTLPININNSRSKKFIIQEFENIDNAKGWKYVFKTQKDYELFVDLLTKFFEFEKYYLPDEIIELQKRCKTRLAKTLGEIYRELGKDNLNKDDSFFKILRTLNHFEKETQTKLYKALTRP